MTKNVPAHLESEEVVLASPMSFTGSARRIWKLTRGVRANSLADVAIYSGVILLIAAVWVLVFFWYCLFVWYLLFVLVVPYRLIRRGQRKRHMEELRHREMLTTIHQIGRELPPAGDGPPPARTRDVTGNNAGNESARDEEGLDRPPGTTGPADA